MEIQVPVGKKIRFHESLEDMYHPFDIRISEKNYRSRNYRRDRDYDVEWYWDSYFEWEVGVDYIMDENGDLVNPNRPVNEPSKKNDNDYRFENSDNQPSKRDSAKNESMDDEDDDTVGIGTSLFSLVKFIN